MLDKSVEFGDQTLRLHLAVEVSGSGSGSEGGLVHEISVPTSSYRMGVKDMGYGSLTICKPH